MGIELDDLRSEVNNRQTILARSIISYFGHYFAHHYIAQIAYCLTGMPKV